MKDIQCVLSVCKLKVESIIQHKRRAMATFTSTLQYYSSNRANQSRPEGLVSETYQLPPPPCWVNRCQKTAQSQTAGKTAANRPHSVLKVKQTDQ